MYLRSNHLSWFIRGETLFLYHDLFGYLLEMSRDLKALVDYFAQPHAAEEAATAMALTWTRDQVGQFIGVFAQHRVLVAPGDDELAVLAEAVPIKGPWILGYRGDDGCMTMVTSRGFGDEPWAQPQLYKLDAWHSDLWRAIDGERTLRQLAMAMTEACDGDVRDDLRLTIASVAAWTHSDRQMTRLLPAPRSQLPRLPSYATSTMPYAPLGAPSGHGTPAVAQGGLDLTAYHQETITDAEQQFEEFETTLSHLFCEPHPALGERTWGQTLAQVALQRGWVAAGRARVIEVGGGTGRCAAAMARELHEQAADLRYRVVELSPALHAAQTARLADQPWASSELGHAERLELPDASVDFALSNEVIADLRIGLVTRKSLHTLRPDAESDAEALDLVIQYDLATQRGPEPMPIQVGATHLIEQLARVLAPGGVALLSEFGEENQFPIESTHLDHGEWSVHFGHLMQVARRLGLEASLESVPELMSLRGDVWVLASNRTQFRNLRYLFAQLGATLAKRALTPEQLAVAAGGKLQLDRIEGLQFRPVSERVMGLHPNEFKALILRRPPA